jgi:hypothetical protein
MLLGGLRFTLRLRALVSLAERRAIDIELDSHFCTRELFPLI